MRSKEYFECNTCLCFILLYSLVSFLIFFQIEVQVFFNLQRSDGCYVGGAI